MNEINVKDKKEKCFVLTKNIKIKLYINYQRRENDKTTRYQGKLIQLEDNSKQDYQ